ncbi:MAG: hypothetical protein EGQ16_04185 [Clostridiales bacterium]|nr:hypothetical protein [Clostridiales bacterium]
MPKKTNKASIEEKLNYLGLDLKEIPKEFKKYKSLEFRIPKFYDEKQYKQYRYVPIKDIQILLSPTHRLDNIEEKYKKARPIADYLDSESEENIVNHTTFLRMLESFNIEDVEKIGEEQDKLNKKIPFKVKYENNYLWQIYYSENTDQYFMLVPTEDSDYSTFFYLLKKQIEKKRAAKIFVPIRNVDYSTTYLKRTEFEDIENYLWLFTKDWPLIYEVYNKKNGLSIEIVGETEVYQKIKSPYKIKLDSEEKSTQFYKLLKAMFILQTELPHYFFFRTDIGKSGEIEFYVDNRKIDYEDIVDWINDEYHIGEEKLLQAEQSIEKNNKRLSDLKTEIATQEIEYLAKEKQISTFLECKKTFFGKFKYFFKYGKKKSNKAKASEDNSTIHIEKEASDENEELPKKRKKKTNYNIEELLELYKEINEKETDLKNIIMDINSLKLKNKNMQKKIENATAYIAEIDSHKKSIFEFWKYSNKDEMSSLPEGEEEEINVVKKITKVFDYEEDIEKFGKIMDRMQRKNLNKDETDSLYITATDLLTLINKIKLNDFTPKDIETALKEIKKEAAEEKTLTTEEFDIFGGMLQDNTKVSKIKNKKHREMPKDKYNILEISKTTKQIGFKMALENVINNVKEAINKVVVPEDVPVYKAIIGDKLDEKQVNIFNINPENEMKQAILEPANKINFYKINLPEGANAISYTNCIFYDNQNRTLPEGQDLSTNILIDITKLDLKLSNKTKFKIVEMEEPNDDFSGINIKNVNVFEFDAEVKKTNENNG